MLPLCAVTENSGEICHQVNLYWPQVRFFIGIIFPFTDCKVFLLFPLPAQGFIPRGTLKHKQVVKIIEGPRAYSPVFSRIICDWSVLVISIIMETVLCCFPVLMHAKSSRRRVLWLFPFFSSCSTFQKEILSLRRFYIGALVSVPTLARFNILKACKML